MIQRILGAVAGVVVAFAVVTGWEFLMGKIAPPPADLNMRDAAAMADFMRAMPVWKFAAVILGYGLAALLGGWIAGLIAKGAGWWTWVPAALLILATIANVYVLPHPMWFPAAAILTILAGAWLSGRLGARPA